MPIAIRLAVFVLAVLPMAVRPTAAGVTEAWVQRYDNMANNSNDEAVGVVYDMAGDLIVTGSSHNGINGFDILTIKYSGVDGSMLWRQRHSGAGDSDDQARALAVDDSGNVVVAGTSNGQYYTAKYAAADGALIWDRRYHGPVPGSNESRAAAVDGSGNVVVTGYSYNGSNYDYATVKYAAVDGTLLWEIRYNAPSNGNDRARAIAVDGSGNVVVTGSSTNDAPDYRIDSYTAMYAAADGALLWEKHAAGGSDLANAVAVDGSGRVVVVRYSDNGNDDETGQWLGNDFYVAKYAPADGSLLWEKRGDGPIGYSDDLSAMTLDVGGNVVVTRSAPGGDIGYTAKFGATDGALVWKKQHPGIHSRAVAVDTAGNVVVTGIVEGLDPLGQSSIHYHTAKFAAADGALLWEKRSDIPGNRESVPSAVAVDGSGNVAVTGSSWIAGPTGGSFDYYTVTYAGADGAQFWEMRHNGPASSVDKSNAVVVDGSGNVVVTGTSNNGGDPYFGDDIYTAKYAATEGTLLWEQRHNSPENSYDFANAVALDGSGNVIVTGTSAGAFYTAKYAASNGTLLWEKRYIGPAPAGNLSVAHAVAVDGGGNVIVTGYSYNNGPNSNADYYTAKYAAEDGALLWENRYNGPVDRYDSASAVTVDGSGDVVVTGTSTASFNPIDGANYDYYTVKYAAATGALLWEKRYGHPNDRIDVARAVAVDSSGNVVVTGTSVGGLWWLLEVTSFDYYTAKYAGEDGALLWEQRYNGPEDSEDRAQALAVDRSGNVVVTGSSALYDENDQAFDDYYTVMYAAANGALLWEKRGPADNAHAVAMDDRSNIVVTGTGDSLSNYYTAKYAAADGALLWEKRYTGRGTHSMGGLDLLDPEPVRAGGSQSLALGPNGMVAVTGTSDGDYATVVYRDPPPPASFADWAARFGLSGVAASGFADPDNDGLQNAVEFILGGNPAVPGTSGRPTAATSGGTMVLTFFRDDESETLDASPTVEAGTDLVEWPAVFIIGPNTHSSSPGVGIIENGTAPDTVTVNIPQGTATRRFARLKVTITP